MKTLRNLLTAGLALAICHATLRGETFPIFEDTAGSATTNTIPKNAGAAKTLAVSAKSNAYINFSVGSASIAPATVTQARLVIFVPKSSIAGTLSIKNLTSGFSETILTATAPAPTLGATLDTINLALVPLKGDYYISDITAQVRAWLATPTTEFGIAITSDGLASAILASKEGAGSGHPAFIEVDVNRPGGAVSGTDATFTGNVAGGAFNGTAFNGANFTGSGASLTSLNASNILTGTLADARLSANVPLLNAGVLADTVLSGNIPRLSGGLLSDAQLAPNVPRLNSGLLSDGQLSLNIPRLNAAATTFTGNLLASGIGATTFTGSGASLTNLNASSLTSGTVADARLATNIPRLNAGLLDDTALSSNIPRLDAGGNVFTGTVSGTSFTGSGASLTAINGSSIATGTVADARLSTNVPLKNGPNTFTGTQTAPAFVGNGTVPVGGIIMWGGSFAPAGWQICDGTNGTPDLRGRFVLGFGAGRSIGTTGGSEFKSLSINELPPHSFTVSSVINTAGYSANYNGSAEVVRAPLNGSVANGVQTVSGTTNTVGGGQSYSTMNPFYVLAYIQRLQ